MDVESPKHLERLRDQPEIKAAYAIAVASAEGAPVETLLTSGDRQRILLPHLPFQASCHPPSD